MIAFLQFGAIGIGLAILAFGARLLTAELKRDPPRPEGRNLIVIFMAFSLIAFGISAFIELQKQGNERAEKAAESNVRQSVAALDAHLSDKETAGFATQLDGQGKLELTAYENKLCQDLGLIWTKLQLDGSPNCHSNIQ